MKKARETGWEGKVAHALGVGQIGWVNNRVSDTGIRGVLTVPCSRGHDVDIEMPTKFPHDVVKKKVQAKGWTFHGRKPVCPDCTAKEREAQESQRNAVDATPPTPQPAPEKEVTMPPAEASGVAIAAATTANATAAAKAAKRAVMQWLDESFEITGENQGRYKAGINDESIAKECKCAVNVVVQLREEFFGKLDRPKELDVITAEVRNIRTAAEQMVKDAEAAAAQLLREATAGSNALRGQAAELEAKLRKVAMANGWAL